VIKHGVCESFLNNKFEEGASLVCYVHVVVHGGYFGVTFLGTAAQRWWYISSASRYVRETDSKQVPRGNYEKGFFEKRVLSCEIAGKNRMQEICISRIVSFLQVCKSVMHKKL